MNVSDSKYSQCLYFSSNALARKMEKLARESWKPAELSPSHGYLLMLTLEKPGLQAGMLAGELQLQPSTITRLLEKLEEKRLIVRVTEGKTTSVFPTAKARELQGTMKACVEHFYRAHSALIDQQESSKVIRSMNKLADRL